MTATDEGGQTSSYLGRILKQLSSYAGNGRIVSSASQRRDLIKKVRVFFHKKKVQLNKKEQKSRHSEAIMVFFSCEGIDLKLRDYIFQKHIE